MLTVGSLFSGIGGFDLGLERAGFSIEWQVENNEYCRAVLKQHWPHVPCHYDIRAIAWEYVCPVDLVCGGFPCQPFSCAGKQRGQDDDRYLWPEVVRCLAVVRPTWFLGENVYGLLHLGIEQVCADLEALGYSVAVLGIPACAVDAPHIRKRLWILAHDDSIHTQAGCERLRRVCAAENGSPASDQSSVGCEVMADAAGNAERRTREASWQQQEPTRGRGAQSTENVTYSDQQPMGWPTESRGERSQWPAEPDVGRVAHGVSARVDRLKGLGNAVVPAIVEHIGKMILEVERANLHRMQGNEASQ